VKWVRKSNVLMLFYGEMYLMCIYSNKSVEYLESTSDSYHRMNLKENSFFKTFLNHILIGMFGGCGFQ
jgi:hypothetical protein